MMLRAPEPTEGCESQADTATERGHTLRTLVRLRRDAEAIRGADGGLTLRCTLGVLAVALPVPVARVLERLSAGEIDENDAVSYGDCDDTVSLATMIRPFENGGWIERALCEGSTRLATLVPQAAPLTPRGETSGKPRIERLSRFVLLRGLDGEMVLESPRSTARIILHEPGLGRLMMALVAGDESDVPGVSPQARSAVADLLQRAGMLADGDEERDQRLVQWSLPDLLFHQRSRLGRHCEPFGGTFRLEARFAIPPPVKPAACDIRLAQPALDVLASTDPPLQRVIESRRSIRDHDDDAPIDVRSLGHFLFRSAGARGLSESGRYAISDRAYPGGGAMYELEVYPVVRLCAGLEAGIYHYEPDSHTLSSITRAEAAYQPLVARAMMAAGLVHPPQIVLVITARVGRMMWKYESMAYATILKHVGVLIHQFYLVATAMGLAPCALGGGDSESFARSTAIDPYEEPSVGEFMLGSAVGAGL